LAGIGGQIFLLSEKNSIIDLRPVLDKMVYPVEDMRSTFTVTSYNLNIQLVKRLVDYAESA